MLLEKMHGAKLSACFLHLFIYFAQHFGFSSTEWRSLSKEFQMEENICRNSRRMKVIFFSCSTLEILNGFCYISCPFLSWVLYSSNSMHAIHLPKPFKNAEGNVCVFFFLFGTNEWGVFCGFGYATWNNSLTEWFSIFSI